MAKCDICGTSIPFGTNKCPNCGYRYRPERKLNMEQKNARKKAYMSQFQEHESPLDGLKNKKVIDFSKIYDDVITKPQRNKKSTFKLYETKSSSKTIKTLIIVFGVLFLLMGIIPLGIGVYVGLNDMIVDDWAVEYEQTEYTTYSSYEELSYENEYVAEEVKPYYAYLLDKTLEEEDYLWQDYTTYGDELYSCYLSGTVIVNDLTNITLALNYDEGDWQETYFAFDSFEENEKPAINETILQAFSIQTGVPYAELENVVDIHISQSLFIGEDFSAIYELNNGYTLSIDYYDNNIDYNLSHIFLILN